MCESAGDVGIELVKALQNFGDAVRSDGIVGALLLCFRSWRDFGAAWRAGGGGSHRGIFVSRPAYSSARLLGRRFRGRGCPRHTVLPAAAGGLTGHFSAGHEGNILAETSVTTGMIDSPDIPR